MTIKYKYQQTQKPDPGKRGRLFSYDVTSETATVEVPAEEENAPPRKVTFTRHTYTVSYAGDAYFADHVFHLTDKQKNGRQLVENLTMFFWRLRFRSCHGGRCQR